MTSSIPPPRPNVAVAMFSCYFFTQDGGSQGGGMNALPLPLLMPYSCHFRA